MLIEISLTYLPLAAMRLEHVVYAPVPEHVTFTPLLRDMPAATAAMLTRRLLPRMLVAAALSAAFGVIGLVISFYADVPSGATVVAVAVVTYLAVLGGRALCRRRAA